MLLMELIFTELYEFDIVDSAEEFSIDWCGRSKSWYGVQKNKGSDLSVSAAITLLNHVKMRRSMRIIGRQKMGSIFEYEITILSGIIEHLGDYLLLSHNIVEVAETADFTARAQEAMVRGQ